MPGRRSPDDNADKHGANRHISCRLSGCPRTGERSRCSKPRWHLITKPRGSNSSTSMQKLRSQRAFRSNWSTRFRVRSTRICDVLRKSQEKLFDFLGVLLGGGKRFAQRMPRASCSKPCILFVEIFDFGILSLHLGLQGAVLVLICSDLALAFNLAAAFFAEAVNGLVLSSKPCSSLCWRSSFYVLRNAVGAHVHPRGHPQGGRSGPPPRPASPGTKSSTHPVQNQALPGPKVPYSGHFGKVRLETIGRMCGFDLAIQIKT